MDELDVNLVEAWGRVREGLLGDPARGGRRWERGLRGELRRPMRAWCLVVKASDLRLDEGAILDRGACAAGERHRVFLFGEEVRALCKPVRIGWPGVALPVAAGRCGVDVSTMYGWVRRGWMESRVERTPGKRGLPTRWVWTKGALDVALPQGRDRGWGTLWQDLWERVPLEFGVEVERVGRGDSMRAEARTPGGVWGDSMRAEARTPGGVWGGSMRGEGGAAGGRFRGRGWDWVCPGRVLADGRVAGCGRRCKKLYLPLPVWTVDRAKGVESMVAQPWCLRRNLACARCWNPQRDGDVGTAAGWNRLISGLSGGLLYGREVARPGGW